MKTQDIDKRSIQGNKSILEALKLMDSSKARLLFVFDKNKFEGLLTIGDIQRAILKDVNLAEPIFYILDKDKVYASADESLESIKKKSERMRAECMPVVDEDGNLLAKNTGIPTTEIVIRSPKSNTSQREIPLFNELWEGLMNYRSKQQEMLDACGVPFNDSTHIFCMPSGKVYDPRTYEDLFKRILKAADLPNINFHALRHTFATRALEAGMDIKVLSSILGHAQASTTLNLYAHALPDHKRQSMEKMSFFYGNA